MRGTRRITTRTTAAALVLSFVLVTACASDSVETADPATTTVPAAAQATSTIPPGVLAAMPFQNRLDVAKGIFQIKLFNGTAEPLEVVGEQFVWAGFTTPEAARANSVLPGGRVDFPVPFVPATCAGDGSAASMPDPSTAVVRLRFADGTRRDVPVYDVKHFARKLYLDDCERQRIDSLVAIEWVDLHEATLEDRPVTEGSLRLTRRTSTDRVTVLFVGNTINFTLLATEAGSGPVAVLDVGETTVSVPVRFIEGRCDVHALSESSQPFNFVARVDLGDGVERSYAVVPSVDAQVPMKARVEEACAILGRVIFVGES